MPADNKRIMAQAAFCLELMERLYTEIERGCSESKQYCAGINNYTQRMADAIRIRRELNTLRKLLNPWEG